MKNFSCVKIYKPILWIKCTNSSCKLHVLFFAAISQSKNAPSAPNMIVSVLRISPHLAQRDTHTYSFLCDYRYKFSRVWCTLRERESPVRKNWERFFTRVIRDWVVGRESYESGLSHFQVPFCLREKISYHPYSVRSVSCEVYVLWSGRVDGDKNYRAVDWRGLRVEVLCLMVLKRGIYVSGNLGEYCLNSAFVGREKSPFWAGS